MTTDAPRMTEGSPEGRNPHRSALEILAERASNVRLDTFSLPGELIAKGFIIQENLQLTPLVVGDRQFDKGSLVAILSRDPGTQRRTFEFRIYEKIQMIEEHGTEDVKLLPRNPIGEQEGLYAKLTPESQLTILRLTAAAITTRRSEKTTP